MITLQNKKLFDLIVQKDVLVNGGRKISQNIEAIEIKVKRFEDKEKRITQKVTPSKELTDRGDEISRQLQELSKELEVIAKKVTEEKLSAIPQDMKDAHMKLLQEKEQLERERNKVALKVQKIKDKIIPIVQKFVKPLLGEYDDIETAKSDKDDKVNITVFNYLDDFKAKFRR
jgi:DNA repair ATPase RecN